jgi:SAM-dependent methyltransferase
VKVCSACGSPRCSDRWHCEDCGGRPTIVDNFTAFAPELAAQAPGFREDYFAQLAAVESRSFWFRARNDIIRWAITTYFARADRYLEIGCGTGFVLRTIRATNPTAELTGSEIFVSGLGFAAKRVPSAQFYQMDARNIPFRNHFDVIGAFVVLEHISEDELVLQEVRKALAPGGGFVATVPQHPALWGSQDEQAHHVRRYTALELGRKVQAAGFDVVRLTSFVSLLLPLMVASRLRTHESQATAGFEVIDHLRLPRILNSALYRVMRVEAALIRFGVSFPAGGSLLMVARKARM